MTAIVIKGHIGTTPELRHTAKGMPYARFRVATSTPTTAEDGSRSYATEWRTVAAWGAKAELACRLLSKGAKVILGGMSATRSWQGRDGQQHSAEQVTLRSFALVPKQAAQ